MVLNRDRLTRISAPLIWVLFGFSGCAGLIYQSIWAQYLGLFLGHAAYAQSLVLAIFMGGMAVGAWWASIRAIRWRNLLLGYAAVELVIGVAGLAFHPSFLAVTNFAYNSAFPALGGGAAQVFKWICGGLLILPQSILLGATFPLLSNGLMRRLRAGNGAILSGLYFTNSIGAAAGALVATFVLLPGVGLPGAMRFAATLNIVVAAGAVLLARNDPPVESAKRGEALLRGPSSRALLLCAAFITGATSFVYEIGWVRMLSLALGSTVHAFELMLAAFVGGLAFGGLWLRSRIDAYAQPIRIAGRVQILMGLAALASLVLYDHSFDWVAWFMGALARSNEGYALFNVVTASIAIVIMAPTAFFAGMTLPLFTLALQREGDSEASVGRIYAANTVGAIVGVFAAVHVLIPKFGLKLAMLSAAAGDLALGIVLLRSLLAVPRIRSLAIVVTAAIAMAGTMLLARFDPVAMSSGVYRTGVARLTEGRVVFYRDGKTASIASKAYAEGTVTISTNGKPDAGIQVSLGRRPSSDEITMIMLAALPLATHPDPHTAAVIGFGSGLSTHTLLGDPRVQRVDTVEIEPAMYEGAKVFGKRVARAYDDVRSHVIFDDAKAYFAANQSRYDIIVSEPSNPWVSGVASLFSIEFYRFVPRHLNPRGVFVQWMHLYEIDDELVATVGRALAQSFADFRIYLANDTDMIIVAKADGPMEAVNDTVFREGELQTELKRVGLDSPADFAVRELGNRRSMLPLFDALSSRMNSDFAPILSLEAPRTRFAQRGAQVMTALITPDLPTREVLAGLMPVDPDRIVLNQDYSPAVPVHNAVQIGTAMRDRAVSAVAADASASNAVNYALAAVGQCQGSPSGTAEVDALAQLAARTIPYLDSARLEGVWSAPQWLKCDTQPKVVRLALSLIDALARRDFGVLGEQAKVMLNGYGEVLSPAARDWILRAAMLAAIAQHDYHEVRDLDIRFGRDIAAAAARAQRAYLISFAQSQRSREQSGAANPDSK